MGSISDRTKSAFGRRRFWIRFACLPLGLSFIFLLTPALSFGAVSPEVWFTFWTFVFFIFWTMFSVPYEAFGAEVSFDYHERTKLFGFREGALVLGTLCAAAIPWVFETYSGLSEGERFFYISALYALLLIAAVWICLMNVRERDWALEKRMQVSIGQGLKQIIKNRPFVILLTAYTVSAFGAALPATLILFYVEDYLGSNYGSAFLMLYFLIGFLCLPLWVRAAKRVGKKEAWITAMLLNSVAFMAVFFLKKGDLTSYTLLVALSAIGYGATLAIPSSMQADVIDYDESLHGSRREGQFIGLWSIAKKLSAALGVGIALIVLDFVGYQEGAASQSQEALLGLRFLYSALPCLCNFAAVIIAWKYPIDEAMFLSLGGIEAKS